MNNVKGFTNTQKIKEEAANWLLKIEETSPLSPQESNELKAWVATSDTHRSVIIRMSQTWNNMDVLAAMRMAPERTSRFSLGKLKALLGLKILTTLFTPHERTTARGSSILIKLSSVTACLIVCLLMFDVMVNEDVNSQADFYVTEIGEYQKYTLEDGSTLWLNSNSKVKVDYSKKYRRIALLTGEAHFEVEKDASRPFEVYANNRLVRALGTAFSVQKLKDGIEVIVSEGTVELAVIDEVLVLKPDEISTTKNIESSKEEQAVAINKAPAKVTKHLGKLSAGQSMTITTVSSARIERENNHVVYHDKGEVGRKLSWLDGKLVFAGETLAEVVTEISRHTSIKIDIPEPGLRKLRIGGHFEAGETDKLFNILESGFGIKVKKIDDEHVELLSKS
jgi:transmembrane sensor